MHSVEELMEISVNKEVFVMSNKIIWLDRRLTESSRHVNVNSAVRESIFLLKVHAAGRNRWFLFSASFDLKNDDLV